MADRVNIIVMAVQVKHGLAEPPLSANEKENDVGLIFGF